MSQVKHTCVRENAPKMAEWIRSRGGVAVWQSVNLSNPGASWSTPALTPEGTPYPKPTWEAESSPSRVITDASEIEVAIAIEVKRFHVAIRRGSEGLSFKLTDGSSRKLKAAVAKAGDGAWYEFDYSTQEAVIYTPGETVTLDKWMEASS
jgi:hypothetical protein